MHAEGTASVADRGATGQVEELQPVAEQHVIMRHATQLLSLGGEGSRLRRKSDSAPASAGALPRSKPYRSPDCREHSETVQLKSAARGTYVTRKTSYSTTGPGCNRPRATNTVWFTHS